MTLTTTRSVVARLFLLIAFALFLTLPLVWGLASYLAFNVRLLRPENDWWVAFMLGHFALLTLFCLFSDLDRNAAPLGARRRC